MADQQKMDFASLQAGIAQLDKELQEVGTIGTALNSLMQALGNTWTGDASGAYRSSYLRWKVGYDNAVQRLQDIENNTVATLNAHADAEAARSTASTVG